jgi:hypothetical protein
MYSSITEVIATTIRRSVGIIGRRGFMKYVAEMASDGKIYMPNFMIICLGIQVILRLLPRQF